MKGVAVPGPLEAVVLACLEKSPARRPQSAAELGRQLDACAVEPWDSVRAHAWWVEHQAQLDAPALQSAPPAMSMAVDAHSRSIEGPASARA